jgi:hypothetical protein
MVKLVSVRLLSATAGHRELLAAAHKNLAGTSPIHLNTSWDEAPPAPPLRGHLTPSGSDCSHAVH